MMRVDCLLCRIVAGTEEASVVYQDDRVLALCDLYPVNPGHLLQPALPRLGHHRRRSVWVPRTLSRPLISAFATSRRPQPQPEHRPA
jgi:hypothetical protein